MCKKILYVDDDNMIRESFSLYLGRFYEIECAENGKIGLEKFLNSDEYELIITDINMPIMNGLDMIENIRKVNDKIHIYITSAFDDTSMMEKAFQLKTNRFIEKPLRINEVIDFIKSDFAS